MEDEVQDHQISKLGSRIAARFSNVGLTAELPELQGQAPHGNPKCPAFCRS
jgi:hypothetical protein